MNLFIRSKRAYSAGAKRILETYTEKIKHKAKSEGLSVNVYTHNLINKSVPRDGVQQVRRVESQVNSWRAKHSRSKGTSVFMSVPWLDKKKEG